MSDYKSDYKSTFEYIFPPTYELTPTTKIVVYNEKNNTDTLQKSGWIWDDENKHYIITKNGIYTLNIDYNHNNEFLR